MTVANTNNKIQSTVDGTQTDFPYDFIVHEAEDMKVYFDDLEVTTGFTVTELDNPLGGLVVFDTAPVATIETLTLVREIDIKQQTDYTVYGAFPPERVESDFDKGALIDQQFDEKLGRALLAPISETGAFDYSLPAPIAGHIYVVNGANDAIVMSEYPVDDAVDTAVAAAAAASSSADDSAASAVASAASAVASATSADDSAASAAEVIELLNVDTVAGIRLATSGESTNKAFLAGYYISGDGGGGDFYWDPTSTEPDDNGTIFKVASITVGRWKRIFSGSLNVRWFGAKGDGSTDDTVALEAAIGFTKGTDTGTELYIPTGIYLFSETTTDFGLYINQPIKITGDGVEKTVLKNASATGAGVRCAGGYITLADFTIDNNGSTGIAYRHGGQYSISANLKITGQSGANYACVVDGTTLCTLNQVKVSACINGIRIAETTPSQYITFNDCSVEVGEAGTGLKVGSSSNCTFNSLYIEPENSVTAVEALIDINGASEIEFNGFGSEFFGDCVNADVSWVRVQNSKSVFFNAGRLYESLNSSDNTVIFGFSSNKNVVIRDFNIQATSQGLTFIKNIGALSNLTISGVNTDSVYTALGLDCTTNIADNLYMKNWYNSVASLSHQIDASNSLVENVTGAITVASRTNQTFINCPSVNAGTGLATAVLINSAASSLAIDGEEQKVQHGTFTPVLWDDTGVGVTPASYSVQTGTYTKIGRQVNFNIALRLTSLGSLGLAQNARIAGLPFPTTSVSSVHCGLGETLNLDSAGMVTGFISSGDSFLYLNVFNSLAGTIQMKIREVSTDGYLFLSGTLVA